MSRPPAITFHSFPRSLSRCVLQHQRQLFWVFILFFFFFSYDFVVCRLWQNSSKYPTLPGFLMSSVYVDLAFQHSACFSFTFDVVMHRSTFSPAASVFVCVCNSVRKEYLHLQFVLTAPRKIFRTLYTSTELHHPLRPLYCSNFFSLCIVSSICCAFRLLATCRSG